jgi:pimeloyl-ACP methyl ester carboxylesterase
VADKGIDGITNAYLDVIRGLPAKPIVIGHSFGGLIAQKLLSGGAAAAAIAIDPGQIKGVKPLPFAQIRSGLPVLSRPGNRKRAVALTPKQFRYGFGNAISESESGEPGAPACWPLGAGLCESGDLMTTWNHERERGQPCFYRAQRRAGGPGSAAGPGPREGHGVRAHQR